MNGWLEVWRYAREDRARMARLWCIIGTVAVCATALVMTVIVLWP